MTTLFVASPAVIPLPLPGAGLAPLNLVPVDFVIDAIHAIVSRPETVGRTFHVVDPNPLSTRRVYETIAERAGKKLSRYKVPQNLTKALLRIPQLERFAPVSHHALDYLNHMAFYNSRNVSAALEGSGLQCPPFESYVEQLMSFAKRELDR
jgi:nucleoside-diphosphate-sugar epimerase